jgi:hypothetical protein
MRNSCGAILYTHDPNGVLGIILGEEGNKWFPFKGCSKTGETLEETAKREINEETCGLVYLDSINLQHKFSSKKKKYYIGLCYAPYNIIEEFEAKIKLETRLEFKEKKRLKFFPIDNSILYNNDIHNITKASIEFYWDKLLQSISHNTIKCNNVRYHGVSYKYIKKLYTPKSMSMLWRSSI